MSLTAHILLNKPTRLPIGNARAHFIEQPPGYLHGGLIRNSSVKSSNIERVFAAVAQGACLIDDICDAARLSKTTAQQALNSLYTWPGGPRVTYTKLRQRGGTAYRWEIVK